MVMAKQEFMTVFIGTPLLKWDAESVLPSVERKDILSAPSVLQRLKRRA